MALWHIPGQGIVDDSEEGAHIPEPGSFTLPDGSEITWGIAGTTRLPEYTNRAQYGDETFAWDPALRAWRGRMPQTSPGYVTELLGLRDRVRAGQAQPWEVEQYQQWEQQARAIPTRDIGSLTAGWQGEVAGDHANQDWWTSLDPGSPDVGGIVLTLRDKLEAGQATPQERALYHQVVGMAGDWNSRASVPQASDAFNPLGDNLFGALGVLGLGATGGLAAAPLFAGGAGLATTLGSLGTLSGIAGTGAGVLGQALDQPWLRHLGLGLGIAGGLAGGLGGLSNVLGSGVNTFGDAARLAQSAGRITGSLGRIPGADPLQQASRYLGLAGQLGQGASGIQGLLGAAQGVTQGAGQVGQTAQDLVAQGAGQVAQTGQDLVTQRGDTMSAWDESWDYGGGQPYDNWSLGSTDMYAGGSPTFDESYGTFLGWGGDERQTEWYQNADLDTSSPGGGWLNTILGGLGSLGGFLGRNAGVFGPAASGLTSLLSGRAGANASNEAARLQANALNRGLDLQTAQWLQQQANQAPWLEAGRTALGQMVERATWDQPTLQQPGLPGTQAFQYSGPGMPGTGFQYTGAGMPGTGFQYTGPGMPDTGFQYTGPGMPETDFQYANQFPLQEFTAPTWEALQARDPGIAARLTEAQQGLEASAAARGGALSGPAMAALQRQSQTLASQEYDPAYRRALGEYQQEYGQDWQRQQEAYGRALAQNQQRYGRQYQQQADMYGRQLGENQQLYTRGYQQQGDIYSRQLAENQLGYNRQWQQQDTDYQRQLAQNQLGYGRGMEQYKLGYGQQAALNEQDYARNQALYQQQMQQMTDAYNAARLGDSTAWNRLSALAGLGQTAVGQLGTAGQNIANQQTGLLGQLGSTQAMGTLGSQYNWNQALSGGTTAFQNLLRGLNV